MLLAHVLTLVLAAHAAGFAQGALVGRAVCSVPPAAVRPAPRVAPRWSVQPERGNRRF